MSETVLIVACASQLLIGFLLGCIWESRQSRRNSPVLTGKDAKDFMENVRTRMVTPERLNYLRDAARASKAAEKVAL